MKKIIIIILLALLIMPFVLAQEGSIDLLALIKKDNEEKGIIAKLDLKIIEGKEKVDDLLALFKDFGFTEWVKKIKRNETYKYNKNKKLSIELNNVKHLGYFMEMEYLCRESEAKKAIGLVTKVLKELKIDLDQIDNTGYTKMLWYKGTRGKQKFIDKETAL